jgi:hypothetical protein
MAVLASAGHSKSLVVDRQQLALVEGGYPESQQNLMLSHVSLGVLALLHSTQQTGLGLLASWQTSYGHTVRLLQKHLKKPVCEPMELGLARCCSGGFEKQLMVLLECVDQTGSVAVELQELGSFDRF